MAWLLRNAALDGSGQVHDLALENGKITALGAGLPQQGRKVWDVGGSVVLPGLIDAHVHLDKTYLSAPNESGTLQEAIARWQEKRPRLTAASYRERARRALRAALLNGVTAMRTHVDVKAGGDFTALEVMLELREELRDVLTLQIVALGNPGANRAETSAMTTALALGADLVGGAPALAADPEGCLAAAFDLAERFGVGLDLHVDETEDPDVLTLETLAEMTLGRGFGGRVAAGHCCSLAFVPDDRAERVMDKVAAAGVSVVTLPSCNLVLMGRGRQPAPRGLTRVGALLARGVTVAAASDNVRDPFNPLGHYDPLFIANLSAHAAHLTSDAQMDACLALVTTRAAQVLGLPDYGLRVGADADLVVLDTTRYEEAVSGLPGRRATFKRGRLVVRQRHEATWAQEVSGWT